jgi:hypothetical protein
MPLIKRSQVKAIEEVSRILLNRKLPVRCAHGLAKNLSVFKPEIDGITGAEKTLETYEKGRVSICEKHAKKDVDGKAILKNGNYEMVDNDAFISDLKIWREASKEYQEFDKFMAEEIEVNFQLVKIEDFPSEIEGVFMEVLLPIVG